MKGLKDLFSKKKKGEDVDVEEDVENVEEQERHMHLPRNVVIVLAVVIVLITCVIVSKAAGILPAAFDVNKSDNASSATSYSAGEQSLYDSVKAYLADTIKSADEDNGKVAETAVENYDAILASNVTELNEDHTNAIKQNMTTALQTDISNASEMSEEQISLISGNLTNLVINELMKQMDAMSEEQKNSSEYKALYDSLKEQAEDIQDSQMKVSISAAVKDAYIDPDVLLSVIDSMTDAQKKKLYDKLEAAGKTSYMLTDYSNKQDGGWSYKDTDSDQKTKGETGKTGATGATGKTGATGAAGSAGAKGATGEKGATGSKGEQGKSVYMHIKYAEEDPSQNASAALKDTPDESTKYMGVYSDTNVTASSSAAQYTWTQYKDLSITASEDSSGVTTLIIK